MKWFMDYWVSTTDFNVWHENDKTIINYSGTACDKISKNIVDVNEEVVLDFIVELRK